jgi:tetratricopeptide (TPR) repeat protein
LATLDATRARTWDAAIATIRKQVEKAPDKPALRYLLGVFLTRLQQWDDAEAAFKKAIELQPDNAAAYLALSEVFTETKKDDAALVQLDKVLQVNSNDVSALMLKGAVLQQRDPTNATIQYERILALKPGFFPAVNNLACLYWENPQLKDKAFEMAKQARNLAPKDPFVADTLGWMAYQRGDYRWALTLVRESAERLSNHAEVLYHLGMCEVAMGNEAAGRDALARALDLSKTFLGAAEAAKTVKLLERAVGAGVATREEADALVASHPGSPAAMVRAGATYERFGDLEKAAQLYEKTLAEHPSFVPAAVRLGKLYSERLGNPERALALAKQAREGAPGDAEVADTLAWILFKSGDFKWALSLLSEGAVQQTESPETLYHLGLAYYVAGKIGDATNSVRRALGKSETFVGAAEATEFLTLATDRQRALAVAKAGKGGGPIVPSQLPAYMALASEDGRQNNRAGARAVYERVLAQYPDFVPALRELALLHMESRDSTEQAFKIVSKAREMLPADMAITEAAGRMAYARRQYEYAARLLQECSEKNPDRADALFYLGLSYHQLRNKDLARKTLRRALEMHPDSELAAEARRLLAQP